MAELPAFDFDAPVAAAPPGKTPASAAPPVPAPGTYGDGSIPAIAPIPGAPGKGANTPAPDTTNGFFNDLDHALEQSRAQTLKASGALSRVGKTQYSNSEQVAPFSLQKGYDAVGFDPTDYQGNSQRFHSDWGDTLTKSLDDFNYKFSNSFSQYWQSYYRMGKGLLTADWSALDMSEDDKLKTYYQDQLNEQKNRIFQTQEEDESFFNKQFVKDFLGNSGFALGTFAGMGLEIAADIAIESASFGGATPVVAADAAAGVARATGLVSSLKNFGQGLKLAGKSAEELRAAGLIAEESAALVRQGLSASEAGKQAVKTVWDKIKFDLSDLSKTETMFQKLGNVVKQTPVVGELLGTGERLVAAKAGGYSAGALAGISFQGFRRSLAELNMAASEAAFESVTTYGDTMDRLLKGYQNEQDGEGPSASELKKMQSLASQASGANYNTNIGVLLASNKLAFGNLFTKFLPANKLVRDFTQEINEQVLTVGARKIATSEFGTTLYQKGFLGTYGLVGKIAKDYGKKEALYQVGKTFLKDFLTMEASEGLQENLQETSAAGWRDYYSSAYSRNPLSLYSAMGAGAREQFSKQGLKTFMLGAFTGSIIHGPTTLAQKAFSKAQDLSYNLRRDGDRVDANNKPVYLQSPQQEYRQAVKESLEALNRGYQTANKDFFNRQVLSYKEQTAASSQMTEAARVGNVYEFENGRDNSLLAMAKHAARTNTVDALVTQLREVGNHFTPEQFKEAFSIDIADTHEKTVAGLANSVADRVKNYVDVIADMKRALGPVSDPQVYQDKSKNKLFAAWHRATLDDAVEVLAMNKIMGDRVGERARSIAENFSTTTGLDQSSDLLTRVLTSGRGVRAEAGSVLSETSLLRKQRQELAPGTDPKLREELTKQIESKENEFKLLQKWSEFWTADEETVTSEDGKETLRDVDSVFVGKQVGQTSHIDHEDVVHTFRDLVNLRNERAGLGKDLLKFDALKQSFTHVADYIQLQKDQREYLNAAEQISSPESFLKLLARMRDGKFKAQFGDQMGMMMRYLQVAIVEADPTPEVAVEALRAVHTSAPWLNMRAVYHTPEAGVEMAEYVNQQATELAKVIQAEIDKLLQVDPSEVEEPAETPEVTETETSTPDAPTPSPAPSPAPAGPGPTPAPATPAASTPPAPKPVTPGKKKSGAAAQAGSAEEGNVLQEGNQEENLDLNPGKWVSLKGETLRVKSLVNGKLTLERFKNGKPNGFKTLTEEQLLEEMSNGTLKGASAPASESSGVTPEANTGVVFSAPAAPVPKPAAPAPLVQLPSPQEAARRDYMSFSSPTMPNSLDTPEIKLRQERALALSQQLDTLHNDIANRPAGTSADSITARMMPIQSDYDVEDRVISVARNEYFKTTALYKEAVAAHKFATANQNNEKLEGSDYYDVNVAVTTLGKVLDFKYPGYEFVRKSIDRMKEVQEALNKPKKPEAPLAPLTEEDDPRLTDSSAPGAGEVSAFKNLLSGLGITPTAPVVETPEFTVDTTVPTTITDVQGEVVATVTTPEAAEELSTALNNSALNGEFARSFFAPDTDEDILTRFQAQAEASMQAYNQKNGTNFQTLSEYKSKGGVGMRSMKNKLLGLASNPVSAPEVVVNKPAEKTEIVQATLDLKHSASTGIVPLSSTTLEKLKSELEALRGVSSSPLQVEGKSRRFVEQGPQSPLVVGEKSTPTITQTRTAFEQAAAARAVSTDPVNKPTEADVLAAFKAALGCL